MAKPFLKWVGGKRQLLPELIGHIERLPSFGAYHEPFLGGGALFFELVRLGGSTLRMHFLSDANDELISTYQNVAFCVDEVIASLKTLEFGHRREQYDELKAQDWQDLECYDVAARMIYLNRAGFNGLYRVNKAGQFNVAWGKREKVTFDYDNIRACSEVLQCAQIRHRDFWDAAREALPGDLVYFDPPYVPVSKSANFTSYTKDGFTLGGDQCRLVGLMRTLSDRGVHVMTSNSDCELTREIYAGFRIHEVQARRNINSDGAKRGCVGEIIVTNW